MFNHRLANNILCVKCSHAYGISFTDNELNPILFSSYNCHTLYEQTTTAAHFNKVCYHTPFRALDEPRQCYYRLPDQHTVVPLCRKPTSTHLNSAVIQLLKVRLITWYESTLGEYRLYSFFNHGARWAEWLKPWPGCFTHGKESQHLLFFNCSILCNLYFNTVVRSAMAPGIYFSLISSSMEF